MEVARAVGPRVDEFGARRVGLAAVLAPGVRVAFDLGGALVRDAGLLEASHEREREGKRERESKVAFFYQSKR